MSFEITVLKVVLCIITASDKQNYFTRFECIHGENSVLKCEQLWDVSIFSVRTARGAKDLNQNTDNKHVKVFTNEAIQ